ncbi:TIGR03749 family integrating conjugative element protein [Shewanella colwelliana]|uniref:TIGR03749 family integrating conjugative element protein n=1 Tax=Shewanella colwelliana TaxID=23 RepID=UPI003734CA0E
MNKNTVLIGLTTLFVFTIAPSLMAASTDMATEVASPHSRVMVWKGKPLQITLPVGQEVMLSFDGDVRVGVPSTLYQSANVDSLRGTVYITANQSFDKERIQIERLRDGMRMLIDVNGKKGVAAPKHLDILTLDEQQLLDEKAATTTAFEKHVARLSMPIPTLLTRFAYQNLYSPAHAIEALPGVTRQTMQIDKDIQSQAFPLWPVTATPVAAWSLGEYTVTAVTLTHLNNDTLHLDPRQVTASLYGVSFAFPDLGPQYSDTDTSTAFMVSKGALVQALPPKHIVIDKGEPNDQ